MLETEDRRGQITVLTARAGEFEDVLDEFSFEQKLVQNHAYYYLKQPQYEIRLSHVGVGPDQTRKSFEKLQKPLEADLLLVIGTAGALHSDLQQGGFFIPTAVTEPRSDDWLYPEPEIMEWIAGTVRHELENRENPIPARAGPLLSSSDEVINSKNRKQLFESNRALAVDMETSTIVQQFLNSNDTGIWAGLRIISDSVKDSDKQQIIDQQQQVTREIGLAINRLIDGLE
ncbi:MAG: hypothetical protein ABEJ65_06405 [bacterium]